jgi:aryl-alcohol dehydrogenase-like predicted oxidoreductase
MRYNLFGRSGLRVSELALGTGTFGTRWGRGSDPAESRAVFDRYAEAGGNFVDTADVYQFGESEEILADLLAADRDHFVLGTKFTMGADPKGGVSRTGNSRKNIVRSLEDSLRRLRTDRVDLYWAHMSDGMTPVDQVMRALDDLVSAGKVLYVGLSDFPAWRAARAATLAELRSWAPVTGLQVEYSLAERTAERELLPMAEGLGMGVTLWSPLGGGLLTGKQRRGEQGRHDAGGGPVRTEGERETAILDAVEAAAAETGADARAGRDRLGAGQGCDHRDGDGAHPGGAHGRAAGRQPRRARPSARRRAPRSPRGGQRRAARLPARYARLRASPPDGSWWRGDHGRRPARRLSDDLKHLRIVVVAAECGSFSSAARS